MLIESDYLKNQIKEMAEVTERNDPGGDCALHHACNMVRATLEAMLETIDAIERYSSRSDIGPMEVDGEKPHLDTDILEEAGFEL